ncbi:MAG: hypothetical protein KDC87_15705, partial [Planctomycetes bacterium]|nr:hypothetical protein [Planctomycetota bacterium]
MRLERVRFRGVPGVEHDLDLRFASGLNVVLGSNGSGKSTLMALVRDSLWKPDPKGCRGEADLEWRPDAGGAPLDHALRPHGRRLSFPGALPPMAQCYAVHIRDLLPDLSGADLAAALRVEIAGGLDLDALRAEPPVLDGRRREARELAVASAELQRVETEQRSVAAEEARLTELLDARDGAASAVRDLPALEARRAWFAATRLAESLRRRVAEFGPVTERLVGDELEQLAQLRRRLDEAQQEMQVGARTVERAAQRIREAGIGEVPPSAAALAELRSLADGIGEHAAELAGLQRALLEHRARARAVQEAVGDPPQSWRTDRAALRRLTRLVQRAEQAARDTAAIDARLQRCRMRRPCATSGALREGHRLLTDWLAADAGLWTPRWAWQSAVALGLVGVGLAFACGGWWSALGGLGVGLLVAPFVQRPLRLARRSELQAAFLELGLAAPERWAARAVRARLRGVNDAWARRRIAERERDFAQGLLAARRTAHKVEARGRDLAQQAAEQLGLELDAAAPLTSLVHFDRLATLHDHTTEVRGLELRIARLDERVREALQRVNRLLTDAGRPEVETPAAARASAASFEADARALAQAL